MMTLRCLKTLHLLASYPSLLAFKLKIKIWSIFGLIIVYFFVVISKFIIYFIEKKRKTFFLSSKTFERLNPCLFLLSSLHEFELSKTFLSQNCWPKKVSGYLFFLGDAASCQRLFLLQKFDVLYSISSSNVLPQKTKFTLLLLRRQQEACGKFFFEMMGDDSAKLQIKRRLLLRLCRLVPKSALCLQDNSILFDKA